MFAVMRFQALVSQAWYGINLGADQCTGFKGLDPNNQSLSYAA